MTRRRKILLIGLIAGVSGIALIGFFSHWLVALGVFLAITGNNIERRFL